MPIYQTKNAYYNLMENELMEVLDEIKEHLTDGKYLELCNKLKKNADNKEEKRYVQLTINKKVKDIIERKHPEMINLCDDLILKINKDLPDWYDNLRYSYIIQFIEKFEDNLIKLVFNKLTGDAGKSHLKRMKEEYPKEKERKLMEYMLADNDCDCCSLVRIKEVRVARFLTPKDLDIPEEVQRLTTLVVQ